MVLNVSRKGVPAIAIRAQKGEIENGTVGMGGSCNENYRIRKKGYILRAWHS